MFPKENKYVDISFKWEKFFGLVEIPLPIIVINLPITYKNVYHK